MRVAAWRAARRVMFVLVFKACDVTGATMAHVVFERGRAGHEYIMHHGHECGVTVWASMAHVFYESACWSR